MTIFELYQELDSIYNVNNQEPWDKSGLYLFANNNSTVAFNPILSLDINHYIIDFAISKNSNLIISHHPIYISDEDINNKSVKKIINRLIENKISIISLHTCFDMHDRGMNYEFLKKIGCKNIKKSPRNEYLFFGDFPKKISLKSLMEIIKEKNNLEFLTTSLNDEKYLNICKNIRIGFSSGSGSSSIESILLKDKCNVFISSEIKWHIWNNYTLNRKDILLIDVPHSIEKIFIDKICITIKSIKFLKVYPLKLYKF